MLFQELLRGEQVVAIVLLQHRQPAALDAHRLRLDVRRHVAELEVHRARAHVHLAHLAHQTEVLVVDGDAHLFPLLGARHL
ncbi:MAG: hypothetical protein L6Q84_33995, partial [Polyangiaceae bacterium]|nr:hypothetical protein [Polyangiaceae bacterium]